MEIITHLIDYISPEYNQKSKDIFSRLSMDKYLKLLNFYTNQNECNINDYTLFKLDDIKEDV